MKDGEFSSNNLLCESLFTLNNVCFSSSIEKEGKECNTNEDCVYSLFVGGEEAKATGNCICSVNGHSYCEFSSSANETKELKQAISSTLLNYTKGTVHVAEENFMSSKEFQNAFLNFYSGVRDLNQTIVDYIFKCLDNENEFLHCSIMMLMVLSILAII